MKVFRIIVPVLILAIVIGAVYIFKPASIPPSDNTDSSENIEIELISSNGYNKEELIDSEIQETPNISLESENQVEENLINDIENLSSNEDKEEVIDSELQETPNIPLESQNQVEENLNNNVGLVNEDVIQTIVLDKSMLIYGGSFLIVILGSLLIVTFLLFREVRWRKRESTIPESIIFPNAHLDKLEDLTKWFEELGNSVLNFGKSSITLQQKNELLANQTIESISKFNDLIDEQKNEINRLKEGYDYSIKKHPIRALIEIKELIITFLKQDLSDETKEKLNKIENYVDLDLEELDIEEIIFYSGVSIKEISGDEFETSEIEITEDENLHGKVVGTINAGYVYVHPNGKNVVKKAKLKVYKKED